MAIATPMHVGTVTIQCPACPTQVDVVVTARIDDGDAHAGQANLICEPDMTDLWAHMWTHEPETT